ncbi:hypothetical protein F2Q68_00009344 [Brassica cretica]|uniref:DUF4283 domain-containing protein n=2 Tax=Brassica cretica TaxID=69181 RepID=A0A8S9KXD6_BRACR|nr:hypothetical protein F2Q68_00009344 [Brassica cretica]
MWGKGVKLEIHLQPQKRSFLVRIANEFTRSKVLAKQLWYVGTSMFYVSQWGSPTASEIHEIVSIPLWAHLSGVPFDLGTKEGLSLAAGLVGEPIETDDYTKNLTDLNVAHVKVEADLTKPLPSSEELLRQNGDIIPISIEYPWTPSSCTHCLRIGHIRNDCIYAPAKDATKVFPQPSQVGVPDPPDSEDLPADPKIDVVPAEQTMKSTLLEDSQDDIEIDQVSDTIYPITTGVPDPPDDDMIHVEAMEIIAVPSSDFLLSPPPLQIPPIDTDNLPPLNTDQLNNSVSNPLLSPYSNPPKTQLSDPSSSSPPSPVPNQTLHFASSPTKAKFVFGLTAPFAPTFGSYITTQQTAAFNAPAITLPPQFCVPSRPPLTFIPSQMAYLPNQKDHISTDHSIALKEPPPGGTPPPSL